MFGEYYSTIRVITILTIVQFYSYSGIMIYYFQQYSSYEIFFAYYLFLNNYIYMYIHVFIIIHIFDNICLYLFYECINLRQINSLFIEFLQNNYLQHTMFLSLLINIFRIQWLIIELQFNTSQSHYNITYTMTIYIENLLYSRATDGYIFAMIKSRRNSGVLKGHSCDPIKHHLEPTVYFIYFENGKLILKSFYRIYIYIYYYTSGANLSAAEENSLSLTNKCVANIRWGEILCVCLL